MTVECLNMELFLIIFLIAIISIVLAVRSLKQMNRKLHEVEEAKRSLNQGKVLFHEDHSPLSSESSEEK